ncbi:hypothetical protein LPJ70_003507 [Coemansia sp. RSA 2708]|nr:hypothetical protein LPJ70_003507 [Coemansia sp. RSA 2708]
MHTFFSVPHLFRDYPPSPRAPVIDEGMYNRVPHADHSYNYYEKSRPSQHYSNYGHLNYSSHPAQPTYNQSYHQPSRYNPYNHYYY